MDGTMPVPRRDYRSGTAFVPSVIRDFGTSSCSSIVFISAIGPITSIFMSSLCRDLAAMWTRYTFGNVWQERLVVTAGSADLSDPLAERSVIAAFSIVRERNVFDFGKGLVVIRRSFILASACCRSKDSARLVPRLKMPETNSFSRNCVYICHVAHNCKTKSRQFLEFRTASAICNG